MSIKGTMGVFPNWFQLLGTLHWVLQVICLYPPLPSFSCSALLPAQPRPAPPKPQWSQECRRVSASVWDLARQKLRVTSTPSHFEMDPWWQLLGDPSDVSISLSKEIARGSTRSPWANQTLHKAQMDALSPACYCWGGEHSVVLLSPPEQLEQTPIAGVQVSVQPSFSSNYVYLKRAAICLTIIKKGSRYRMKLM